MFISIDGHQSICGRGHMVDGDAPHTLAFIVSSVFKVLLVDCTQTLRSEANFACMSGGAEGGPAPLRSFR